MNLDQDFIKYESTGNVSYYGYATPDTLSSDKRWAIRQVTGTVSLDVKWNMNVSLLKSAIWDNREAHFLTPVTASVGITSSTSTNSFGIISVNIGMTWSEVAGVDRYRLSITDHNNVLYNYLGTPYLNTYTTDRSTCEISGTSYAFVGQSGMTYSISVESVNQAGTSDVTYTYAT